MKKNTLIEVEWDDTFTTAVWHTEKYMYEHPVSRTKTIGYFINKDKQALRLSHSIQLSPFSERDGTIIPIGCITKIRRLKH